MYYTYTKEKPELELFEGDISKSIKSLFDSILDIDASYLHYTKTGYGDKQDRIYEQVERVFAYELYRCWTDNKSRPNGTIVNAEISKQLYSNPMNKKVKLTYPDMVLHGGQDSSEHFLVCEIKRYENIVSHRNAQVKDLNRLGYYLDPNLSVRDYIVDWKAYQYGVFILIGHDSVLSDQNSSMDILKENINNRKAKLDVPYERRNKIICLAYNGDKKNIFYTTLNQLI